MQDTRRIETRRSSGQHQTRLALGWVVAAVATMTTLFVALGFYDAATGDHPNGEAGVVAALAGLAALVAVFLWAMAIAMINAPPSRAKVDPWLVVGTLLVGLVGIGVVLAF